MYKSWWRIGRLEIWVRLRITWTCVTVIPITGALLPAFPLATGNLSSILSPGKCDSLSSKLSRSFYSLIKRDRDIKPQYGNANMGPLFNSNYSVKIQLSDFTVPRPQPQTSWGGGGSSDHFRKAESRTWRCTLLSYTDKQKWLYLLIAGPRSADLLASCYQLLQIGATSSGSWGSPLYLAASRSTFS